MAPLFSSDGIDNKDNLYKQRVMHKQVKISDKNERSCHDTIFKFKDRKFIKCQRKIYSMLV